LWREAAHNSLFVFLDFLSLVKRDFNDAFFIALAFADRKLLMGLSVFLSFEVPHIALDVFCAIP
jgi:hypothetical protein